MFSGVLLFAGAGALVGAMAVSFGVVAGDGSHLRLTWQHAGWLLNRSYTSL